MNRNYEHIIEDYVSWYYNKTKDPEYEPTIFFGGNPTEVVVRKGKVWQTIMNLCYDAKYGIYWFCKFILGDLTYAGYPQPIEFNKLWLDWTDISKKGDHIAIMCSRQQGKSTYWTVIQTVYRVSMFENYNVLIESATEDQAIMLLGYVTSIMKNNDYLLSKIAKSSKWSTTEVKYNGGKILAKGMGSEVRGGTYDYIVIDDVLRSDNKLSDDDVERFIDEELEPMILVRKGQIVLVGTPRSSTDIFTSIEERINEGSLWTLNKYPVILDWDKKIILCPERFTWDELMRKRLVMGKMKFDKEFMCKCYSSGAQLFSDDLRKMAKLIGRDYVVHPAAKISDTDKWTYYMGIDTARAGTASADYTVVIVLAYNPTKQLKRVAWMWRKKGLKTSEQVDQIAMIARNFNYPVILVERNNFGQDFIDMLVDNYNLHVESFHTGAKGQGKEDLIRFLINTFEHEKMILPTGDERSKEMVEEIDKELSRFVVEVTRAGNEVMKGSGHSKDDIVMSLALANKCSQHYGYTPFAVTQETSSKESDLGRYAQSNDIVEILRL